MYWNGSSWASLTQGTVGETSDKTVSVNMNHYLSDYTTNVRSTLFKIKIENNDNWSVRFYLYGIGAVIQKSLIKGKSPVGVTFIDGENNEAPCYYKPEGEMDSTIFSKQFMSETILRGSCINDVAGNDLHIQPPNRY